MSFLVSGLRRAALLQLVPAPLKALPRSRLYSSSVNSQSESAENIEVHHSKFLSEASSATKWKHNPNGNNGHTTADRDSENVAPGKGTVM
jgi:hypothetical protein